eukprot:COSAG05_NODE_6006_length_1041_cov_2.270701_1_plen_28_part_10
MDMYMYNRYMYSVDRSPDLSVAGLARGL